MADAPALELRFCEAPGPETFLRERLYAALDDFRPVAIQEDETGNVWRVFFHESADRDAAAASLAASVAPQLIQTRALEVKDDDWARRSQQGLTAIQIGRLIVAPPWDVPGQGGRPPVDPSATVILIEPSMGFGTGHHATTRLCLRLLQSRDLRGKRVIDVGTGSGVLALAAWKLGAADVVAVDSDLDALDNARANIASNGAAASIDVVASDLASLRLLPGDVVLANLTAATLVKHAEALRGLARPEGCLVLSGFGPAHLIDIQAQDGSGFGGLQTLDVITEDEWAAIALQVAP